MLSGMNRDEMQARMRAFADFDPASLVEGFPTLMTTAEVGEAIRRPAETVRYWRAKGTGPAAIKIGRRVLYPRENVAAWLGTMPDH